MRCSKKPYKLIRSRNFLPSDVRDRVYFHANGETTAHRKHEMLMSFFNFCQRKRAYRKESDGCGYTQGITMAESASSCRMPSRSDYGTRNSSPESRVSVAELDTGTVPGADFFP